MRVDKPWLTVGEYHRNDVHRHFKISLLPPGSASPPFGPPTLLLRCKRIAVGIGLAILIGAIAVAAAILGSIIAAIVAAIAAIAVIIAVVRLALYRISRQ